MSFWFYHLVCSTVCGSPEIFKMFMVLCTLFTHINIIQIRQKIYLILTEYYTEHNAYMLCDYVYYCYGQGSNPERMSDSPSG